MLLLCLRAQQPLPTHLTTLELFQVREEEAAGGVRTGAPTSLTTPPPAPFSSPTVVVELRSSQQFDRRKGEFFPRVQWQWKELAARETE